MSGLQNEYIGKIGIYKPTRWRQEKEWRFRFWLMPAPLPPPCGSYKEPAYAAKWQEDSLRSFNHRRVDNDAFFLALIDETFLAMQVHLGPQQSAIERGATRELIAKFNLSATIVE